MTNYLFLFPKNRLFVQVFVLKFLVLNRGYMFECTTPMSHFRTTFVRWIYLLFEKVVSGSNTVHWHWLEIMSVLSITWTGVAPSLSSTVSLEQSKSLLILSSFFWQPSARISIMKTKNFWYIIKRWDVLVRLSRILTHALLLFNVVSGKSHATNNSEDDTGGAYPGIHCPSFKGTTCTLLKQAGNLDDLFPLSGWHVWLCGWNC